MTTTTPLSEEEHYQIVGVETDEAAIEKVVKLSTAAAAVSILCNLVVLFLASRKKETDEESHQPIYQRIMSALAISGTLLEANYFVAGISGSALNVMTLKLPFQGDEVTIMNQGSESISIGCYMQAFVDAYFYIVYIFCCVWLCLYFLLKLNYGVARVSKCAEVSAYLIIFLLAFGDVSFSYMDGGTVASNPSYGICSIFPQSDIDYYFFPMILGAVFLLGILSMLLIIFKTFRDEQEINRMTSIQQGSQPFQGKFEATKDIAIQAFALVIFLFFGFYLQVFAIYQTGFVYEVTALILYLSQGVYNLTLYLWFEVRNKQKQFPDMSKKDILLSIFNHDLDSERRFSQVVSTEQTPLMVDRKRCLVDMTLVENDMCEGVLRDLDEIDRKVNEEEEDDEEMVRQRQAKREEEARRQKLQAENMQMHSGAYTSVKDMEDFQKLMLSSFDDMKQELADRKQQHYNSSRESNVPVRLRYGSIDPSTFRIDETEKEIDNLSADGTRDPLQQPGEAVKLPQIQEEENGEADTKKKAKEDSVASSQDLSGLEEGAFEDDEDDNVAAGAAPPMHSGYTFISDLTSISTLRF
ncbi:predicted protein [Chaetoceros tenuissimus]|uniref:G-protein coupled receptors family 1 profile domain-containing protein n=1 Tax=Chaetoceros tenuissimus TaxID=426638 RepID=A0AAD3CUY6_9STRA|nr:predicted protein [Chaetoceros tenuissimus]